MMPTIAEIASWTAASWIAKANPDYVIDELVIDSRKVAEPAEALFIALATDRRDGHEFIAAAYEKGIRNFIVSISINTSLYPESNFLQVPNTLFALQAFTQKYREQFHFPVLGITGSNGKTIVKEWLYQLLQAKYSIVRSPRSYNSQIGVPLSVWQMNPYHNLAIFEAGISKVGEMEKLNAIIQPDIGIITNIGEAHSEGFASLRQKAEEKIKLFRHAGMIIYCRDYPIFDEVITQYAAQAKDKQGKPITLFSWSRKKPATLVIQETQQQGNYTCIRATYNGQLKEIRIPFMDQASIENAVHCWCYLLCAGIDDNYIGQAMSQLQPIAMRLELRQGINDCTLINDVYSSDLTSLHIALEFLEQQKQFERRTVILSDMLEVGKSDEILYEQVAAAIAQKNIYRFIGVGPALMRNQHFFTAHASLKSYFYLSTEELLAKLHTLSFEKEMILLKGARKYTFEKISLLLEQKIHQTVLSINLSALLHNLNIFRAYLKKGVKTMAMVKAFSYGSGSHEIAHLLQYAGVDYLTVAYTDEGVALRKAGITIPIMVMSPDWGSFDRMIAWKLEPEIFNFRSLNAFLKMANTLQVKNYPIHIKLDTGMHRLGFSMQDLDRLVTMLHDNELVQVVSIFSHLVASEDPSLDHFTLEQSMRFDEMSQRLCNTLPVSPLRHLCNSAAITRHPNLQYDMVRLGIGLYGVDGSGILHKKLRHVGTLKTVIAQIHEIPAGDTVGYGRKGVANHATRIATICIGYADGYPRSLGNGKGYVLVHGKKASIIGVVCMDMCMVDITDISEAKEGDEVTIMSPELPVTLLASWAQTIPYEIMTGISQRVKRVYVNEA